MRRPDPLKWSWILVTGADVVADRGDQITNASGCAATDALAVDFRKPAFDLIQPRRTGRSEVQPHLLGGEHCKQADRAVADGKQ